LGISAIKVFVIAFVFSLSYCIAPYIFGLMNWHWHNAYNIFGFGLFATSMPWSYPYTLHEVQVALKEAIGQDMRNYLGAVVIAVGFSTNVVLIKTLTSNLVGFVKYYRHLKGS